MNSHIRSTTSSNDKMHDVTWSQTPNTTTKTTETSHMGPTPHNETASGTHHHRHNREGTHLTQAGPDPTRTHAVVTNTIVTMWNIISVI